MTDNTGRVLTDQALVNGASATPVSALTGFDPSRVYRSQGYAMAVFDQGRDADGAPLHEVWGFAGEDDYIEGDGYLELRIHEIVETQKSGTIAVYYRQWFAPDGEPAFGKRPKRRVGSLASVKALISRRKMMVAEGIEARSDETLQAAQPERQEPDPAGMRPTAAAPGVHP